MRNLTARVIVFFVGILVLALVLLLDPFSNHVIINAMAVVVSALGAVELSRLFSRSEGGFQVHGALIPLIGGLLPAVQLLILFGLLPGHALSLAILAVTSLTLLVQVVRRPQSEIANSHTQIAGVLLILVYPGLFLTFFVRISEFAAATALIMLFLATVFAADTIAYLAGMLYRWIRRLRQPEWQPTGIVPASPNKTFVGFVVGWLGAIGIAVAAVALFPRHMPVAPVMGIPIGAVVGLSAIIGDLVESTLKRSATQKDSGDLIPGRGGILDSVDSVLYAAPAFYYLLQIIL